jgi:hypothetical protein
MMDGWMDVDDDNEQGVIINIQQQHHHHLLFENAKRIIVVEMRSRHRFRCFFSFRGGGSDFIIYNERGH